MQEPYVVGRFFLRVVLFMVLLLVAGAAKPLLSGLEKYPIEIPLVMAFWAAWVVLIVFFEKLIFKISRPKF